MGTIQIEYTPKYKNSVYTISFNPSDRFNVQESSTLASSFEACLAFLMDEFTNRTSLAPSMEPFTLKIHGNEQLPSRQKHIIEGIIDIYNRAPELYNLIADAKSFQRLGEFYGHLEEKIDS